MNNRYSYKNASSNFRYINSFHLYLSQSRFILKITQNNATMWVKQKTPLMWGANHSNLGQFSLEYFHQMLTKEHVYQNMNQTVEQYLNHQLYLQELYEFYLDI